jgi:hypothetical protein
MELVNINRDYLLDLLQNNLCRIVFTKVSDGSKRIMYASLSTQYLPEVAEGKEKVQKAASDAVIRVFDVEVQEWRSFRVDSLSSIKIVDSLPNPTFALKRVEGYNEPDQNDPAN